MIRRSVFRALMVLSMLPGTGTLLAQGSADANGWRATAARVERATLADDGAGLRLGRADLLRALAAGPSGSDAVTIRYSLAYADWRLSTDPHAPSKEQSDWLNEAATQLKAAVKLDPKCAEAWSLLSSVYGMKIARSSISGIVLGPRASAAIDKAMKIDPNNPRTLTSKGIGRFNTPGMFGGSEKEAEALLRSALARFDVEPIDQPFPAWGRFDAHAWLGQVLAKRGDQAGARAEYAKALEIAPQSHWVKNVLLPALDKR